MREKLSFCMTIEHLVHVSNDRNQTFGICVERLASLAEPLFLKGPSLAHPNMIQGLILLLNTILSPNITSIHINVHLNI
jgi:hypothetical protein